ncbi:hypothetical protein P280DRAFT_413944 [Massarina eburnea CBS 473.64]|uniref:Uncharacterized protein n=1 Tax=Massarina eburnea CBS 473.64 TaxID=1395130 RepID=A0A6A6RH45_9PLEO|nr:hypothetical protein P280DRAFT_413944 [Massarina eburnea CBS 473.64]
MEYSRSHILGIPRELRNQIYKNYTRVEGGYIYDPDNNTMVCSDGTTIDLALMFVCQQIASELKGLAFEHNSITFRTVPMVGRRAAMYDDLIKEHYQSQTRSLMYIDQQFTSRAMDDITRPHLHNHYIRTYLNEQRRPFGQTIPADELGQGWGCAPSLQRSLVASTLEEATKHPEFSSGDWFARQLCTNFEPWAVPSSDDIAWLLSMVQGDYSPTDDSCRRARYSAATAAIAFLWSISADMRVHIRKVLLDEDASSIAFPECHAEGLLPFFRENPRLFVERKVHVWHTMFNHSTVRVTLHGAALHQYPFDEEDDDAATRLVKPLSIWLAEARELMARHIPAGSFRLTLEGGLCPDEDHWAFEAVMHDAAWQIAFETALAQGGLTIPRWADTIKNRCFVRVGFPELYQELATGSHLLKCNFEIPVVEEGVVEAILAENEGRLPAEWQQNWFRHRPASAPPYC